MMMISNQVWNYRMYPLNSLMDWMKWSLPTNINY